MKKGLVFYYYINRFLVIDIKRNAICILKRFKKKDNKIILLQLNFIKIYLKRNLRYCMATNSIVVVYFWSLPASEFARNSVGRLEFHFSSFLLEKLWISLASRSSGSNDRTRPWPLHHFYTHHISCRPNVPTNDALFRTQFG